MRLFTCSVGIWIRLNFSGASERNVVRATDCALTDGGLSEAVKRFCFYSSVKPLFGRPLLELPGI